MLFSPQAYLLFFLVSSVMFNTVNGHGYLKTPRSRNFVAHQDGVWSAGTSSTPAAESCPQCLNRGGPGAVCGRKGDVNYDFPPNSVGGTMGPNIQGTFLKGESIVLDVVLTAHHKGHFSFYACPITDPGVPPTQDCFNQHPLEFEEDLLYGAPKDPSFPDRAYIPPLSYSGIVSDNSNSVPGTLYSYRMKLPDDIEGDLVLLQWWYVSGNSCTVEGYDNYNFPPQWGDVAYTHLAACGQLPVDGDGTPEQFWNCAEISVSNDGSDVTPTIPGPSATPIATPQPTPAPIAASPTTDIITSTESNRMIAYLGNWQACPTAAQLAQYTHVVIAFSVSYTWAPGKNDCSQTCEIATPPVCDNSANPGLLSELKAQGKKIIVSFGGAGMGGSWAGDQNNCWDYCFGRETQVVDRLAEIVEELGADGVDIDYEYFYEDNQNGSGFTKGQQAQNFLTQVTVGLRNSLPSGAEITHAPMDSDLEPHTAYFQLLKGISHTLDFIMPQYYNGVTRPVLDGIDGSGAGSISALEHYNTVAAELFGGDATRMVFGFCISDCSGTSSNANGQEAAKVMIDLSVAHSCNGGAFFWVANDDRTGEWSSTVNQAIASTTTCSEHPTPITPAPTDAFTPAPTPAPTDALASPTTPVPTKAPTKPPTTAPTTTSTIANDDEPCCPRGYSGIVAYNDCMEYHHCWDGELVGSPMPCPAGTLFSNDMQYCDWAMQVSCPGKAICH